MKVPWSKDEDEYFADRLGIAAEILLWIALIILIWHVPTNYFLPPMIPKETGLTYVLNDQRIDCDANEFVVCNSVSAEEAALNHWNCTCSAK